MNQCHTKYKNITLFCPRRGSGGDFQEEYAEENFYFWQSSEQFASSLPTVAKAQTLYDGYIREGAPKQARLRHPLHLSCVFVHFRVFDSRKILRYLRPSGHS